jgi:flagellar motor switch protein FliG
MEGRQIFNLIKHEQPQTISFVLSYLDGAKSAEVFALLSPDLREEVIERLGTIESTSLDLVGKIVRSLGKHFDTKVRPAFHHSGGVRAVADLLNQLDKEMSKTCSPASRSATPRSAPPSARSCSASRTSTASRRPTCSACCARSTPPTWRSR